MIQTVTATPYTLRKLEKHQLLTVAQTLVNNLFACLGKKKINTFCFFLPSNVVLCLSYCMAEQATFGEPNTCRYKNADIISAFSSWSYKQRKRLTCSNASINLPPWSTCNSIFLTAAAEATGCDWDGSGRQQQAAAPSSERVPPSQMTMILIMSLTNNPWS